MVKEKNYGHISMYTYDYNPANILANTRKEKRKTTRWRLPEVDREKRKEANFENATL